MATCMTCNDNLVGNERHCNECGSLVLNLKHSSIPSLNQSDLVTFPGINMDTSINVPGRTLSERIPDDVMQVGLLVDVWEQVDGLDATIGEVRQIVAKLGPGPESAATPLTADAKSADELIAVRDACKTIEFEIERLKGEITENETAIARLKKRRVMLIIVSVIVALLVVLVAMGG